jgi:hypothetical protein
VPAWLAGVVARTLERDPANRYATAGALLADLEAGRAPGVAWSQRVRGALAAAAAVVAVGLAGVFLAVRGLPGSRPVPPQLRADGARGVKAVDDSGRVIWRRSDVLGPRTITVVRMNGGKGFRIAAVTQPNGLVPVDDDTRAISFLDPSSGRVTESHPLVNGALLFTDFSDRFRVDSLRAVDLEGDGDDELVAVFVHNPYFPSYAVLFEPRSGASRVLLASSGHARLAGAFDLDGDGRRELVFDGPNNRMGWMSGVAAIRVPPLAAPYGARADGSLPGPVASPDTQRGLTNEANLLWYALGSTAAHRTVERASFDPVSRLLTLLGNPASRVLTADGFAPGGTVSATAPERQAARNRAYALLRDAGQREETGFAGDGLALARQAVAEAVAAGDEPLAEWARRVAGRIAILAGQASEGEAELSALLATSEAAPDIAYEMARAFHLSGDAAKGARWYAWGLSRVRAQRAGRVPNEFLEGQLFALVEESSWADAERALDRFEAAFPQSPQTPVYRGFLRWRRGERTDLLPEGTRSGDDFGKYWALEIRLASGEPLDTLTRDLAAERAAASDSRSLLLSLSSEVEARRGNLESALAQATTAWSEVRAARSRHPWARAHAPVVAERLIRLAGKAGRADLARETRAAIRRAPTPPGTAASN